MKKSFIFGLAILLVAGLFTMACQNDGKGEDNLRRDRITVEPGDEYWKKLLKEYLEKYGDFEDDTVSVLLTNDVTLNNLDKIYTPEDFPEIDCFRVDDSTELVLPLIRAQIEAEKTGIWSAWLEERRKYASPVNIEKFKRMLLLHLTENSKTNVLKAVELLSSRKDIEWAGPNGFMTMDTVPVDTY